MATDRLKLDPEIRAFLDGMRARWAMHPPFATLDFPAQRAVCEQVRAPLAEGGPAMVRTIERLFDPGAGPLHIRAYFPEGAATPAPALIYLHGGGFTLFSIDTHDRLMREYAARGDFAVIGVDYPLSPEHKFPEALNRIVALIRWLDTDGGEIGVDPGRLAIGGDSAGANLSIAAALRLRDAGESGVLRAILANYGYFSNAISDAAEAQFGGPGSIMDRAEALSYYDNYLTDPVREAQDPYACPLHAELTGLPPTCLVIPEYDVLIEQSLAMARCLAEAGVATQATVYPGTTHSFLEAMSMAAVARRAISDGAAFIRAYLA
ncbi:alpha/beta hydrolase fold domain-containing protein [Sphingomonas sp.]|uniref:alpha/beta hydrolase fold domain-containing protein n=1 Tax=Sphingomonas sp. TaxID=28214 RepID=UPI001EC680A6|nr:alpha/beta hydrolase fold domain-containing protein [Sphingomonas sp.]MBX3594600.1 alpha/beta hydrolase fold domain-containing protein [Sphingomonas sp.]